ncbi:hypothetical protein BD414DRAFT_109879 [Trametes punicea]|nr:hypothetical protein BD414DRAFT_109879 [Trametes punicea]
MFSKSRAALVAFYLLAASEQALARIRWMERDGRPVFLHPRRFGQEHPAVIDKLSSACPGEVCGTLAGAAITPLLAAQPECSQQDMADQIIDAAQQFDDATKATMIALAVEYRQAEKNTPPDFTTDPPTNRNSVFCQKAPKNSELNGLVQAQDPANDPNVFFDPATGKSVKKGDQPNTFPFGTSRSASSGNLTSAAVSSAVSSTVASSSATATTAADLAVATGTGDAASSCESEITVTVTATAAATDATSTATLAASLTSASTATSTASVGDIGNFGSCSVPQIEFGVGFDNRKETSFQPVDKTSYNHGSAQNIDIITQFICDTLTNSCGADQTAKDTCQQARAAADTVTAKTGGQADAFNAVFGIQTDFAAIAAVDDQGNVVPGTGSGSSATTTSGGTTPTGTDDNTASSTGAATRSSSSSGIGDFGSCSVPQIEFGTGFDGRKETSFQPVDKTSYNHGSAQNIDIITQFICDTLTNSCGADATAKATCASAQAAADTKTAKTGAQADAFNAVFGITTDFASVAAVDDQGNVIAGSTSGSSSHSVAAPSSVSTAATTAAAATTSATAAAATSATSTSGVASGQNLQTFTGALGGITAPPVTQNADGTFQVQGNSAFQDLANALTRSCDVQHNQCANAANASGNKGALTVAACGAQQTQCDAAH